MRIGTCTGAERAESGCLTGAAGTICVERVQVVCVCGSYTDVFVHGYRFCIRAGTSCVQV